MEGSPIFMKVLNFLQGSQVMNGLAYRESLRNILLSVYGNKDSVDDDLIEIIREPALDEGALDAFVSIVTGPPGPNPIQLMPKIKLPVLILWGDEDPFTPLDGPVGQIWFMKSWSHGWPLFLLHKHIHVLMIV
ncbi:putative alpha/Beta hydrolase [Helianthus debilis subsp. tardiflorus]